MAKPLILSLEDQEFSVNLKKIDRDKLYGKIEIEVFDEHGNACFLKILTADGSTMIDSEGGTALAMINELGDQVDRKDLIPVNAEGEELEKVESSFSIRNALTPATVEEYLSIMVKTVYLIEAAGDTDLDVLDNLLKDNILRFDFSYRGGIAYDQAFLISNLEGIFMITGEPANLKFVTLNQSTFLPPAEEQSVDEDDLDFGLM